MVSSGGSVLVALDRVVGEGVVIDEAELRRLGFSSLEEDVARRSIGSVDVVAPLRPRGCCAPPWTPRFWGTCASRRCPGRT